MISRKQQDGKTRKTCKRGKRGSMACSVHKASQRTRHTHATLTQSYAHRLRSGSLPESKYRSCSSGVGILGYLLVVL